MTSTIFPPFPASTSRPLAWIDNRHRVTVELLMRGGRVSAENPDPLRQELTRLGLAFATCDDDVDGTTFRLIR